MKIKIAVLIGTIALATLSFTFASVDTTKDVTPKAVSSSQTPVGGLLADEVVKE